MDYSKLSDAQLEALYNNDYSKLSNEELQSLYNSSTNQQQVQQEQMQEPVRETKKGLDLRPHTLLEKGASAVTAPIISLTTGKSLKDAYNLSEELGQKYKQEHPSPIQDFATDIVGYSLLEPLGAIPASAITGGIEGMNEGDLLGGMLRGGALGGAIRYGKPALETVQKVMANKLLNSNIIPKTAEIFANVPQNITRYAKRFPEILKQDKTAKVLSGENYYANQYTKLGKEYLKNLEETSNYIKDKIAYEKNNLKNVLLDVNEPDFNKLLMEDLPKIFKEESDVAYKAINNNPSIKKELYDYYKKTLYDKKPTTLHDLNKFKEDLVEKIKSKYIKVDAKKGTTSKMSNEEKLTNSVERTIDQFLKSRNPELAKAQDMSYKMLNLQKELGITEGNIADKLQKLTSSSSTKKLERRNLKALQDMFLNKEDTLTKAKNLKVQEELSKNMPNAEDNMQIFTRRALPFFFGGATGLLGGALGTATGLGLAGLSIAPRTYGRIIQNMAKKSSKNIDFNKTSGIRELLRTIGSQQAGKTPLLEGYVSKTRED